MCKCSSLHNLTEKTICISHYSLNIHIDHFTPRVGHVPHSQIVENYFRPKHILWPPRPFPNPGRSAKVPGIPSFRRRLLAGPQVGGQSLKCPSGLICSEMTRHFVRDMLCQDKKVAENAKIWSSIEMVRLKRQEEE